MGLLPGMPLHTSGLAISGDGNWIGGAGYTDGLTSAAYRWSQTSGYQPIPTPPDYQHALVRSLNTNGSIAAGTASTGPAYQAFRWTETAGTQMLGFTRPGHFHSETGGMSRDGLVVVGNSFGFDTTDAFRWDPAGGMSILPTLPGSSADRAYGTNHDGSFIVGEMQLPGQYAVMWTSSGIVNLGHAPGYGRSIARAVNDAGTVVVGEAVTSTGNAALVWTQATGMRTLVDYLGLYGVTVPDGFYPIACTSVSADGNTIVGYTGYGGPGQEGPIRGFVATIPAPWAAPLLGLLLAARRRRR